jgi:DNA-binding MarR family transcriptional regulator
MSTDGLLPAERMIQEQLGHLPLDFRAMWAISNVFRSSAAIRRHMEAKVLAHDRLSWTSFVGLWVLWVWGELDAHAFADAVGISRPTATGVIRTLEGRGWVERRRHPSDGRGVRISLTDRGRDTIEHLFPRFNAEEAALASALTRAEQEQLAAVLRTLLRAVAADVHPRSEPHRPRA